MPRYADGWELDEEGLQGEHRAPTGGHENLDPIEGHRREGARGVTLINAN
jgi:hypothetical protein